ncbi:uncharacterized protein R10E11.6 [Neodiprion pinetum]|uniref:uncharacterized protein R10E11.6 n=1 Tax=Neodiprion pinetum TaxID=441929 RepID=UPI001EDF78EE|nr:synergin gamma-like [Neodiprion pinetum]
MNRNHVNVDKKMSQLPSWLWTTSNLLPPIYRQIWEDVKESKPAVYGGSSAINEVLVDTNKVFPLLLTSQLPTEVLGYIWSLANHKYAGQLTEQELYVVLALVAIAQASYTFNSLDVLHLTPSPPIPNLNMSLLGGKQAVPAKFEAKSQPENISFDTSDEFSDFQSAPAVNSQSVPSVPMIDSRQGSAIGSRLANHNLGVKKPSEKPRKVNNGKPHAGGSQARNPGSKELLGNDPIADLFPKCPIKTQSKVVILKDTAIRSNDLPKESGVGPKENVVQFLDRGTSSLDNNSFLNMQGIRDKVTTPKKEIEEGRLDLMSVQSTEDKYSALRVLVEEPQSTTIATTPSIDVLPTDDFGDFVSAEQPETKHNPVPSQEPIDFFSNFDFKDSNADFRTENMFVQGISNSFSNLRIENATDPAAVSEKFDGISESDKVVQKEDNISVNSIELGIGSLGCLPRSGSVPSLDLKCFLTNSQDDDHQVESMHQLIYWDWKQYMEGCILLLQVAANIFTSITSEDVLHEVLASAQGYDFLCNLAEVAAVCRRVNFSHKELDINMMGFDDLLMDIDRTWAEMEPFYSNIPIVTELPVWPLHHGENITCSLCLTVVTSDRVIYNESSYHVTCANLWLNCISNNLPALSYPLSQLSSTSLNNRQV